MKLTKIAASAAAAALAMSAFSVSAFAATLANDGTGSELSTPVSITTTASTFNVTVPTTLAIAVATDGTVTAPSTDRTIRNNGYAPIVISSAEVTAASGWEIGNFTDVNDNVSSLPVDSNLIGITINDVSAEEVNPETFMKDAPTSGYIKSSEEISFNYDAIVTARSATANLQVANIVFMLDWYTGEV